MESAKTALTSPSSEAIKSSSSVSGVRGRRGLVLDYGDKVDAESAAFGRECRIAISCTAPRASGRGSLPRARPI